MLKRILLISLNIFAALLILIFSLLAGQVIASSLPYPDNWGFLWNLSSAIFGLGFGLLFLYLFIRLTEKRDLHSIGITVKGHIGEFFAGSALGIVLILAGAGILLATRNIQITYVSFEAAPFIVSVIGFLLLATLEEVYFRGYILSRLAMTGNRYIALIISSVLFSLMHLFNPAFSALSMLNIFLAGIFLGLLYLRTSNLWLATSAHFTWNLSQALLGFNVSGGDSYSVFSIQTTGTELITGGRFGFEASILCTVILVIISVILLIQDRKKSV